ncbi:MAG: YkgJ family cysteine cluster protein [Nitrospirae bacterium]|nr:YkgJ family cysteine cluster protein [Nitrospirota bacterium]
MPLLDVPHTLCQSCRQCCHFFLPPEMTPFASREESGHLPPEFHPTKEPIALLVGTREGFPVSTCSRLEESSFSCRSWPEHPLDCRIYPLVFTIEQGEPFIALDTTCPYAAEKPASWFQEKAMELRDRYWNAWTIEHKKALCQQFALDTFPERRLLLRLDTFLP